ncbi:hypothetical protein [Lentzea sp. CA-135723]|uniref:hypothetical protein n=1 Tax=Lentzea sp. CA-135723 TaxID=3239950 RepID=UPI003D938199
MLLEENQHCWFDFLATQDGAYHLDTGFGSSEFIDVGQHVVQRAVRLLEAPARHARADRRQRVGVDRQRHVERTCVDGAIADYLVNGTKPARKPGRQADATC